MHVAGEASITVGGGSSTWLGHGARPKYRQLTFAPWRPNVERLVRTLDERNLDGLIVQLRQNVFYLTGMVGRGSDSRHESESQSAVVISRHDPVHPVLVLGAIDLDVLVTHPTWIDDVRAYLPYYLNPDVPLDAAAFARFASPVVLQTPWGKLATSRVDDGYVPTCKRAIADLGLTKGRVGFDNLSFARGVAAPDVEVVDATSTIKYIRQVKTQAEIDRLTRAAMLNQDAIDQTLKGWSRGMTWFELSHLYDLNVVALGGYVQREGGLTVANDTSPDPVFHTVSSPEDFVIEPGMGMLLDCHGTLDFYRWDGGKTWVVDGARSGKAALIERGCAEASEAILHAMTPGTSVHELQRRGLEIFTKLGVADRDRALVFFHGMGLDHTDVEMTGSASRPDWRLEDDMVIATHVAYPGDPYERYYIEDVGRVTPGGGISLFTWGSGPHVV